MSNKKKNKTNKKTNNNNTKNKIEELETLIEIKEEKETDTLKNKNKKDKKTKNKNERPEKTTYKDSNTNNEIIKLFKIVLIVTGIMIVFYGITLLATNKADEKLEEQKNNDKQPVKTEIQYDNIMIGSMLNHDGTYYVLIEKEDDNRLIEYDSIITTIKASEDAPTIYKANLTDVFNKNYLGKEQNYYVDDLKDFKVTGTTLVKIKDGKIDSVNDSYDTIKTKLKELS